MMDKTSLYKHSFDYARAHEECSQYHASHSANVDCKAAIEKAISDYYGDNRLNTTAAVQEVVKQFGYERMLYVLANTVQSMEHDGRVSRSNKDWAGTVPLAEGKPDVYFLITRNHPGLVNLFVNEARHQHLLSLPLKREDIKAEAQNILSQLQSAQEPNSPNGTHFMAKVSPDFLARASTRDQDRLMAMLPFQSLALSSMGDRTGVYALISKDEDRNQKLVLRRPPVRKGRQEAPAAPELSGKETPVYRAPRAHAMERGEMELYRASRLANIACKKAIDAAISKSWDGMHTSVEAAKEVLAQFGTERVSYVLAVTVQLKKWDERFSGHNREWAGTIPSFEDKAGAGGDSREDFTVASHPAKTEDFIDQTRRAIRELAQEKPSVRAKLHQPAADAPKPPSRAKTPAKGQER